MTLASKTLVLAVALATAPAAARAGGDPRRETRHDDRAAERYAPPPPQPYRGDRGDRFDREWREDARHDRDDRFSRWSGHDRWQGAHRPAVMPWRYAEWRELRRDFWELEGARDRFYASGRHHPREVRRFERWYAGRRAELERRRDVLVARLSPYPGNPYAWR